MKIQGEGMSWFLLIAGILLSALGLLLMLVTGFNGFIVIGIGIILIGLSRVVTVLNLLEAYLRPEKAQKLFDDEEENKRINA